MSYTASYTAKRSWWLAGVVRWQVYLQPVRPTTARLGVFSHARAKARSVCVLNCVGQLVTTYAAPR